MLTKEEAKKALEQGKQVKHITFLYNQLIGLKIVGEMRFIHDQDGYLCPENDFWRFHRHNAYLKGWEIVN